MSVGHRTLAGDDLVSSDKHLIQTIATPNNVITISCRFNSLNTHCQPEQRVELIDDKTVHLEHWRDGSKGV